MTFVCFRGQVSTLAVVTWLWASKLRLYFSISRSSSPPPHPPPKSIPTSRKTTQPSLQWVPRVFCLWAKETVHEVDQASASYIKIKNKLICSFTPLYSFMACTGTNLPLLSSDVSVLYGLNCVLILKYYFLS